MKRPEKSCDELDEGRHESRSQNDFGQHQQRSSWRRRVSSSEHMQHWWTGHSKGPVSGAPMHERWYERPQSAREQRTSARLQQHG